MGNYVYSVFILIIFMVPMAWAGDPFSEIDEKWNRMTNELNLKWNNHVNSIDQKWDTHEKEIQQAWVRDKARIEAKWQEAVRSTKKDWVKYNIAIDGRSRVDFKDGKIWLEAVVPVLDPNPKGRAEKIIRDLGQTILMEKDDTGTGILAAQLEDKQGEIVGEPEVKVFLEKEVLPEIKVHPLPHAARDGVKRMVYRATIDLVPDHIRIRAEKVLAHVREYSLEYNLDPRLVLAVIHTESFFNPKAVSSCGALGLMQIIPRYAGRDAYRRIYGQDIILDQDYLFDSRKNIEIGCAYLHILFTRHFSIVEDKDKRRYLTICGYNWGPTKMRKKIVDKFDLNDMPTRQVYELLRKQTPQETRDYIKKVTERMKIYDPFFNKASS